MIKVIFKISFILILVFFNPVSFEKLFDKDGSTDLVYQSILLIINLFILFLYYFFFFYKKNLYNFNEKLKIFIFNFFFLMFLVFLLELFFGNWIIKNNLNHLNITKNISYEFQLNDLYDSEDSLSFYVRDEFGFRGKYLGPEKINILTLGGSTTAQKFLSEGHTWQDIMQQNFFQDGKEIYVVNAGIDGQSSLGHLAAFKDWFNHIPNLKVDYFLVYTGINDFMLDESSPAYGRDYLIKDNIDKNLLSILEEKSALSFALQRIRGFYVAKKRNARHIRLDLKKLNWMNYPLLSNYNIEYQLYLDNYEKRMVKLIDTIENFGSKAIIVSHSANGLWKKDSDIIFGAEPKICNGDGINSKYFNGVDYYYFKNILNNKSEEICNLRNILYINIDDYLVFDLEIDLYDVMHNTPSGSKKIGDLLHKKLDYLF